MENSTINRSSCQSKRRLTISEKKEILKKVEELQRERKLNMKHVSKSLNIPRSTLLTIINNRTSIEAASESEKFRYRTKNKRTNPSRGKGKYQPLEEALCQWIQQYYGKQDKKTLLGSHVRKKALMLAKELGYADFTASNGWCDRFKKKYNLEYKNKQFVCSHCPKNDDRYCDTAPEDFLDIVIKEKSRLSKAQTIGQQYGIISNYLLLWVNKIEAMGIRVNGVLLRDMALTLAGALEVESFTGSNGWMDKFQKKRTQQKYNNCELCNPNR